MTLGPRPTLALALPAIAGALLVLAQAAVAQQEAPKGDSLERAQKAADAVFHWIKLNADKGANRQQPAAPAAAPAPAVKKATPVAAAPRPAQAPAQATATSQAAAAPAVVSAATQTDREPEPERGAMVLASAAPTPAPAAPMAAAAQAVEPPKPAPEEREEPLRLLVKVEPTIPRQLQQQGSFRGGFAQVQFTVAPDGTVQQASVIKASHLRLGTAAVDAVRQWRFAPIPRTREAAVEVAFNADPE